MHRAERAADRDCARVPASATVREVLLYVRAANSKQPWEEARVQAGQTRAGAASLTNSRSAPAATAEGDLPGIRELERRKIAHRPDPRQIRLVDPRRFPRISASMPPAPVTQTLLIANVAVFLLHP